jgi:alanine racemase
MKKNSYQPFGARTWIEIDQSKIAKNYWTMRKLLSKNTALMGVVKSNAYGHGLVSFSQELVKNGIDALAVDSITEALRLRKEGIEVPILVLGYTLPENLSLVVQNKIEITLSSFSQLEEFENTAIKSSVRVHIKIDTGMHRQGFLLDEVPRLVERLKARTFIKVVGVYTHFSNGKDPGDTASTHAQMKVFGQALKIFQENNFSNIIRHACASGSVLIYPEYHLDMVRVGAGFYGIWPSPKIKEEFHQKISLESVLSWKTVIGEVKKIPPNEFIGYGFLEKTLKEMTIAVMPVGYWHGFPRSLSSRASVLVNCSIVRVLGFVSMDMITIDVSNKKISPRSVVTLIGRDGDEEVSAEDLAQIAQTTSYEILTRLNPKIERVFVGGKSQK